MSAIDRDPVFHDFQRRAGLYAGLDCRLASHTRFFGAAALVNTALAEIGSSAFRRWYLPDESVGLLAQLGAHLERINLEHAKRIDRGDLYDEDLDTLMVRLEQQEVERFLSHARLKAPTRLAVSVRQLNRTMTVAGRVVRRPLSFPHRVLLEVLRDTAVTLGRRVQFPNQTDREAIGLLLTQRLRSPKALIDLQCLTVQAKTPFTATFPTPRRRTK